MITPLLKRTILYDRHLSAQGRMGPVFQCELPYEYGIGREAEYWAAKRFAAVFDCDFMLRLLLCGPQALTLLQTVVTSDLSRLKNGRISYALICRSDGNMLDSVSVIRLETEKFLLIADNSEVEDHLRKAAFGLDLCIENASDSGFMLAIQGPSSVEMTRPLVGFDPSELGPGQVGVFEIQGRRGLLNRFGFTGEIGFELMVNPADAPWYWDQALNLGAVPCGYLATEDLRIGAGFISLDRESGNPFENRLGRKVHFEKADFIGREALMAAAKRGQEKVLVWLLSGEMIGGDIQGADIIADGVRIGQISSGAIFWPGGVSLAMGYVRPGWADEGRPCLIEMADGGRTQARLMNRPPSI